MQLMLEASRSKEHVNRPGGNGDGTGMKWGEEVGMGWVEARAA